MEKKNIKNTTVAELEKFLSDVGEQRFRVKQIQDWVWKKGVGEFQEMKNLPKKLIHHLEKNFYISQTGIKTFQRSKDGTIKVAFRFYDGEIAEGVLIPSGERVTACISSQIGCSLDCSFCATGLLPLKRNLQGFEIYDQIFLLNDFSYRFYGRGLSNIVYMGMGEPLLNYKNVVDSIRKVINPSYFGFSPKRITVSTSGVVKMIRKLADDNLKVRLALSLHSANDEKRKQLMKIHKKNPLLDLKESLSYYEEKTKARISIEYILLKGVNDSEQDAEQLVDFILPYQWRVNLIEYNRVDMIPFEKSKEKKVWEFVKILERNNIRVSVRKSRGEDIDAACGQLANKH
jgi:23S rRNA (adenine2503-C2)-methyltransferase